MNKKSEYSGFTIVELLIVIVVIAILAAITIVSYNGVTSRAKESILKSDLQNATGQLQLLQATDGAYPADVASLKKSDSTDFQYTGTGQTFCLTATTANLGKSFYVTNDGVIREGSCPSIAKMQNFTSGQCAALTTYTGSNPSAIITLSDPRGSGRTYQVAKLVDGKCWMLDNLKLGSTTGTLTLTSADTNIASNFVLPQVVAPGSIEYDTPGAYGSIPGDTGSGATNFGYLYNWPAATAGASRVSKPAGSGTVAYSICAKGWRLPTGGSTGEFAMLNAKMNNAATSSPSTATGTGYYENWLNTGKFKGMLSGYWEEGSFAGSGSDGGLWASGADPTNSDFAYYVEFGTFNPNAVPSIGSYARHFGWGVRCLLN